MMAGEALAKRPEVIVDPGGVPPAALQAITQAVDAIARLAEDQDGGEINRLRRRARDATLAALATQGYFSPKVTLEAGTDIGGETWDIGIVPGKDFDKSKLDTRFVRHIPEIAFGRIMLHFKFSDGDVKDINGWGFTTKTGVYGTEYLQRALITAIGLGANRPQDAIYPTSTKRKEGLFGRAYDGANKYVMHFAKGELPPVHGFWSLTMYNSQYFFVENPINRYSISPRQDLKQNADGSVDLYIQNESPGADKESNWLPAPKDKFILMLRMYWPDESPPSILDGSWKPPAVVKS